MDDNRDKERAELEFEPSWPQRPDGGRGGNSRPRLDPPEGQDSVPPMARRGANGGFGDTEIQPSKWTSHPTSYTKQPGMAGDTAGDTKETQVLPIVDVNRFDNGRPAQPQKPGLSAPPVRPQVHRADQPQGRSPMAQPGANPTRNVQGQQDPNVGPRYTRPTDDYDYEPTRQYTPIPADDPYAPPQAPRSQAQRRPVPPPTTQTRSGKLAQAQYPGYVNGQVEEKRKPRWRWLVWTLGGIVAIVAIVAVAVSLAWQGQYAGKIYPGVSILGTDMGGKTQDEARKLLDDQVQAFLAQPVVFKWNGKDWRPKAEEIGLKVDTASSVNEAFNVGRSGDFFGNVEQQWSTWQTGYGVPLDVQLNEPALMAYLKNTVAAETDQKLFDGDVRLNGTEVVALPGKEGRALDVYATIEAVRKSVVALKAGANIDLPVSTIQPTVASAEVEQVQKELTVRVSAPITATAGGKQFVLAPEALVRFTTIERNPDRNAAKHVTLGWVDPQLKILGDKWASEASRPAQNAKFDWQNGQVTLVKESVDGLEVDSAAVIASIKEHSATADKRQYELPAKVITPTVSSKDMGALGIKEQIGQGVSTFKGSSPERATNIKVAADLLNGTVVAPGATFSFLDTMGGIDEAHGFVPGYVIAAERTQLGVGGGVCQASTTTFRAAFWAGLPITERNQHSYRVGWYEANGEPVGFDAAVFDPGVDLRFVNNTPGYLLIKATTTTDSLTVTIYGTKTFDQVKLEGPVITNKVAPPPDVYEVDTRLPAGSKKQVETARGGLDTDIVRRIIVNGQPDKVDHFHSSYKAWPNWYIVASPSQIPGGAQTPKPTPTSQP